MSNLTSSVSNVLLSNATVATATPSGKPPVNPYHYVPTLWICALFITLYGLTTLLHLGQSVRYKAWWLIPTACLAGTGEIIGWAARLWSSKNVTALTPFLMQISTTIIAPTPLIAANFMILGRLIRRLGPEFSRLNDKWYLILFTSADAIALVIQAVGGAKASIAVHKGTSPDVGGNIMLGGIAFQMAAITIYIILASEFVIRFLCDKPVRSDAGPGTHYFDSRTRLMIFGLGLSAVLLFIRSVYRMIELADGWVGRIITTQVYFNVLDGGMIVLAMFTLNFFHPAVLLVDNAETRRGWNGSEVTLNGQGESKA